MAGSSFTTRGLLIETRDAPAACSNEGALVKAGDCFFELDTRAESEVPRKCRRPNATVPSTTRARARTPALVQAGVLLRWPRASDTACSGESGLGIGRCLACAC